MGAPELALSQKEAAEVITAWHDFAEHWLPNLDNAGLDPKWVALLMLLWTAWNVGAPRVTGLKKLAAKKRAKAVENVGNPQQEILPPDNVVNFSAGNDDLFAPMG